MINFNIGALRSSRGDTTRGNITAANNLVQRTLAQHGLMPALNDEHVDHGQSRGPVPRNPLDGVGSPFSYAPVQNPVIPDGAEFRRDRFTCDAGSRDYRTYIPSSASEGATGIVVMLHGCTQNPEDFAVGTGMNSLAEKHGFVVVYPLQSRGDHAQSCWNWFSRHDQQRDRGEPSILSGITRQVMAEQGVSQDKTFVAGLSAGAAMALILGETYPDLFAAVGAHSGLPVGSARDVASAFAAMAGNAPDTVIERSGSATAAARIIVFHGSADATVHPSNSERVARQAMDIGSATTVHREVKGVATGRQYTRKITSRSDGTVELEQWLVDGLGHAWSGGQAGGSYTDQKGPDASAEMIRFFFDPSGEE